MTAVLGPKEFRREMDRVTSQFIEESPNEAIRQQRKRHTLNAMKIYERADHGPLADVRELIALRLAPWLAANKDWR